MPANQVHILPFDVKGATQDEYAALNKHVNLLRKERLPDDPPVPLQETIQNLHSIPPFVDMRMWAAWIPGAWAPEKAEIVGLADVVLLRLDENRHLAQFELTVLPEYRRQGLGKQLLRLMAETAQADRRRLLLTSTSDRVPAGEAFMQRMQAQKAMERVRLRLNINCVPSGLKDIRQNGEKWGAKRSAEGSV